MPGVGVRVAAQDFLRDGEALRVVVAGVVETRAARGQPVEQRFQNTGGFAGMLTVSWCAM